MELGQEKYVRKLVREGDVGSQVRDDDDFNWKAHPIWGQSN